MAKRITRLALAVAGTGSSLAPTLAPPDACVLTVQNPTGAELYIGFDSNTPSATSYDVLVPPWSWLSRPVQGINTLALVAGNAGDSPGTVLVELFDGGCGFASGSLAGFAAP